jgi:ATP-binding cassette, subfamily C (CFTR/MRP), member 1
MLETSLGSVARLRDFETTVKPEDGFDLVHEPPPNWPSLGKIEFRNVTALYG